jgi:opacity protein-like surface antigen
MVAKYRSILAGAALLVASAAGASADYYRGMKDMPAIVAQPASWYVRGDYSHSWMNAGELHGAITPFDSLSIDNTWAIGGGIGTYFGRGIRGDITYEYRGSADVRGRGVCGPADITSDFDLKSSLLLGNLYYDFRPYERFTPYVGIGVGAAHHRASGGTYVRTGACGPATQDFDGDSNWSAAGALMAGLSFRIDRGGHTPVSIKDGPAYVEPGRLHIDVGYRFLYLGDAHTGNLAGVAPPTPGPRLDDITAHEIRIGLRWDIR